MQRLLDLLFKRLIVRDAVTVIDSAGNRHDYGDGSPPRATVRFADPRTEGRVALAPDFHLLEAYADGTLTVEDGSFHDFLDVCCLNLGEQGGFGPAQRLHGAIGRAFLFWQHYNPAFLARRRVSHHYDLGEDLFRLFLDPDLQYSCAYFRTPDMPLAEAQEAKKRHIAAKLALAPGQRVLDIGSGWGGLALTLARLADVEVVGITLSAEQLAVASRRAEAAGLANRVRFELKDYRKVKGQYDRIVSVGMFEHVGRPHYRAFFRRVRDLMEPDGVALIHSVGEFNRGGSNPWIRRYIFPGSYTPSLSQVLPAVEKAGLWACDVEILRLHYAHTLRAWRQGFAANRDRAAALYDERFCRMWEAYLSACEIGFTRLSLMNFQLQLSRHRHALPLTRDYMVERERAWG